MQQQPAEIIMNNYDFILYKIKISNKKGGIIISDKH